MIDKLTKEEIEYLDYFEMLFENNIRWNFKNSKGKKLEEIKELAKQNNLNINEFRKNKNYER